MLPSADSDDDSSSVLAWAKLAVFGVFHSMRERDSHQRITLASQSWSFFLRLVDALQVLVLALNPTFGWSASLLSWLDGFSIMNLLLPNHDPALFNVVYSLMVVVVGLALADATYVAYMFKNQNFSHIWPLKLLRFMVSLLVTAGFVPTYGVIITPFSCQAMKEFNGDGFSCSSLHRVVFVIVSVLVLAAFIPFGLASSLVFHESNGNSKALTAKVSGRESMIGTIAKLIAASGKLLVGVAPVLVSTSMFVMYFGIAIYTTMALPYFSHFMNQFHVAASMLVAYVSLGSLVLASTHLSDTATFSLLWFSGGVVVFATACGLPVLRMYLLKKKLLAIRPKMIHALAQDHAETPTNWRSATGSVRTLKRGTDRHTRRARRASIAALAGRVREARYRTARLPLEIIDEVLEQENGALEKTVFDGMSAYEVELIVRCELSMEGNVDMTHKRRRFAPLVLTTQAIEHALWLFVEAIEEFCDDPTDIANVKIEYARFLQVFTADVNLATAALESAKKDMLSLEGEFEVFSRVRGLQQKRQSQNLGADRDMNLIALVEYSKRISTALDEHKTALMNQCRMFRFLKQVHHNLDPEDDTTAERLGHYIEAMTASTRAANRLYSRLLLSHPSAPNLGSIYNRFALDVLNDETLANNYSEDDAMSAGAGSAGLESAGASYYVRSTASQNTRLSITDGLTLRTFVPRTRAKEVSFLDTQFQCGTLLLLAIAAAIFATTHVVLSDTSADVSFLGTAGKMQTLTISAGYWARELSLVGTNSTATVSMLDDMRELKTLVQLAHRRGSQSGIVVDRWNLPSIAMRLYAGNSSWYTQNVNLFDCANRLVAHLHWLAESTTLTTDYADDPHWRFAMDNATPVLLPAFEDLLQRLGDAVQEHIVVYTRVQAGLVLVLVVTLFVLGRYVFRRALERVSVIKRVVNEVAVSLQLEDITTLIKRAEQGLKFVDHAKASLASSDAEVEPREPKWRAPTTPILEAEPLRKDSSARSVPSQALSPEARLGPREQFPSLSAPPQVDELSSGRYNTSHPLGVSLGGFPATGLPSAPPDQDAHDIERLRRRMSSTAADNGSESSHEDTPLSARVSPRTRTPPTVPNADLAGETTIPNPMSAPSVGDVSESDEAVSPTGHDTQQVEQPQRPGTSSVDESPREEAMPPFAATPSQTSDRTTTGALSGSDTESKSPHAPVRGFSDGTAGSSTGAPSHQVAKGRRVSFADHADEAPRAQPALATGVCSSAPSPRTVAQRPCPHPAPSTNASVDDGSTGTGGHGAAVSATMACVAPGVQGNVAADGSSSGRRSIDAGASLSSSPVETVPPSPAEEQMDSGRNLLDMIDWHGDEPEAADINGTNAPAGEFDEPPTSSHDARSDSFATVTRRSDGVAVPVPSLEDIFHAAPGALCCADATGTLVAVNDHFCRMLGYPASVSLGSSLSLFVQPDSLKLQKKLVRKLVLTGSLKGVDAEVRDGMGQQIDVVCQSGATMPVLLNMARLQQGGRFVVLLDIQDLRNHLSGTPEDDLDSDAALNVSRSSETSLRRRVIGALVVVGLLQCVNIVVGWVGLEDIAGRSAEVNAAARLRMMTHYLAFTAREVTIGDAEIWSNAEAVSLVSEHVGEYEDLNLALVFGDSSRNLAGSARRSDELDELQFGGRRLADGLVTNGLLTESEWFIRSVQDVIREYSTAGVGANGTTLQDVGALQDIIQRDMGSFGQSALDAVQLFREDSESRTETILTMDLIVSAVHVLLVLALYFVVFHRMVSVLVRQAQRAEGMLLALPEDLAMKPNLSQFYKRAEPTV